MDLESVRKALLDEVSFLISRGWSQQQAEYLASLGDGEEIDLPKLFGKE